MSVLLKLLGKPLANGEESSEALGVPDGVCVFGLDALGSAAYGPEAALTVLLPIGLLGLRYILPLSATIVVLLLIVYFSYRQTMDAYPGGGGAYTVAGQNLGKDAGLLAGASLMLDYLLNVSVGISTGIGALVSAVPRLQPHTLLLCLGMLAILTFANLRGMRESGVLWRVPTLLFVVTLLTVVVIGLTKIFAHGGTPQSLVPSPHPRAVPAAAAAGTWLLLRSFASGCTALTGVEAVSNGVKNFEQPKERTAKWTLTCIVLILGVLLLGFAVIVKAYGITATEPGKAGYQSVLSLATGAVMGRGWFYDATMASILLVLSLSANTSFAGFPQVCQLIALDDYLPRAFRLRGRRLVYTGGVLLLSAASALVLVAFGGVTDRLIPLFAIGAFLAFTLSQAGMVQHWRKSDDKRAKVYLSINAVGAVATGVTAVIVFVAKFAEGAWLTAVVLVLLILLMRAIHTHYKQVDRQTHVEALEMGHAKNAPLLLLPVEHWNTAAAAALKFASALGGELRVLHVSCEGDDCECMSTWQSMLNEAAARGHVRPPRLVQVRSEFRAITGPLFQYVLQAEDENMQRTVAVVFPEIVAAKWYQHVLHNYRSMFLKARLYLGGRRRVTIIGVPWQLKS